MGLPACEGKLHSYVESGIGAIVGFVLAQLFNFAKLAWVWWNRPKLVIEAFGENSVLETGECRTHYGCSVRNTGRRIATGVRVQLVRIEGRRTGHEYRCLLDHAYNLSPFRGGTVKSTFAPLVLTPGVAIEIGLASKKDFDDGGVNDDIIFPSISGVPELFEEIAFDLDEYRYTLVAFDDKAHSAMKVLSIR